MIRHVVLLQWRDDATPDQHREVVERLERLPGLIPAIGSYTVGSDAGLHDQNYDLVVTGDFEDVEAFTTYAHHPDHVAVIDEAIKPILNDRAAVQFEL